MRNDEERREERRKFENDVFYEVWRSGGDTNRINYDQVDDARYNGEYPEDVARGQLNKQRPTVSEVTTPITPAAEP